MSQNNVSPNHSKTEPRKRPLSPADSAPHPFAVVRRLVQEREAAASASDFAALSTIAKELRDNGVEVLPELGVWRVRLEEEGLICCGLLPGTKPLPQAIEMLSESRERARRLKRFDLADEMRDELRHEGVFVHDRDFRDESAMLTPAHRPSPTVVDRRESTDWRNHHDDTRRSISRRLSETDSKDAGELSRKEIEELLLRREQLRFSREYSAADRVRSELKNHGVEIVDRTKSWRDSYGKEGRIPNLPQDHLQSPTRGGSSRREPSPPPRREPSPPPRRAPSPPPRPVTSSSLSIDEIHSYLIRRERARQAKDYETADSLREVLRDKGVTFSDREGMWWCMDERSGSIPSFNDRPQLAPAPTHHSPPPVHRQASPPRRHYGAPPQQKYVPLTTTEIDEYIVQREHARSKHDYETADIIRDILASKGVQVIDRERRWFANDGREGSTDFSRQGPPLSQPPVAPPEFARQAIPRAARQPNFVPVEDIEIMIRDLQRARAARDVRQVDRVLDSLDWAGVTVSEHEGMWRDTMGRSGLIVRPVAPSSPPRYR